MREPLEFKQWDGAACEVACMAQLLWMAGELQQQHINKGFDRRTGRKPNQPDMDYGGLRLVFQAGFHVEFIGENSPSEFIGADGKRKREELWRRKKKDLGQLAKVNDLLQYHTEKLYEVCMSYRRQFRETLRKATVRDLKQALLQDKAVGLVEDQGDGYSHYSLAFSHEKTSQGWCRVYDPSDGRVANMKIADVVSYMKPAMDVYTFPRS